MATTETLFVFRPGDETPVTSNYASYGVISAATGLRECLKFTGSGGSADESAIFEGVWPSNYAGGGINVVLHYSTDGTNVAAIEFEASVEVVQDGDNLGAGGQDFGTHTNIPDTPSTATADYINITAAGAISHVNCGSPSAGDGMRLKITLDHDHSTNSDVIQLHKVVVTEQ